MARRPKPKSSRASAALRRHQKPHNKSKVHPVLAAHRELSNAQSARRSGDSKRAIKICEQLVAEFPDYVGALHELGIGLMAVRDYPAALNCFVRATMLHPNDWTTLASLAQCYIQVGALEMAVRTLEQARAFNDHDADIHFTLGVIYERQREYEAAVGAFHRALEQNPNHGQAANSLGSSLVHLGELDEAAKALHQAHIADGNVIAPIAASAQLPAGCAQFDVAAALDKAEFDARANKEEREVQIAFTKAHLYHQKDMFGEAWEQLQLANNPIRKQLRVQHQNRELFRKQVSQFVVNVFTKPIIGKTNSDLPMSLFILGVSRSGKTTVERLTGKIPGVKRGYENPIVELAVKRASQEAGLLTINSLLDLPVELGETFSTQYVTELNNRTDDSSVFTNTHPGRIGDVGLIAKLVPNAKFVFLVRNREDTAIRILMKNYSTGTNAYAYDIQDIFEEIDWYHSMMFGWHKLLPDNSIIVEYEQLVENPSKIFKLLKETIGTESATDAVPNIADDRGCAEPYLQFFNSQKS